MDEGDGRTRQAVGRAAIESLPRVDHKDGSPAQEEEEDNDQEHADHALLGDQVGCGVAAAHAVQHWLAAGAPCEALLLRRLQVTAITITWLDAASAGLSVCHGRACNKKTHECNFISSIKTFRILKVAVMSLKTQKY